MQHKRPQEFFVCYLFLSVHGAKIGLTKKKLGLGLVVLRVTKVISKWQGFFEDRPWVI